MIIDRTQVQTHESYEREYFVLENTKIIRGNND